MGNYVNRPKREPARPAHLRVNRRPTYGLPNYSKTPASTFF